jgi:hypothetical protein
MMASEVRAMKRATARSLIVFVFLTGVAALMLDVAYAQGRRSGGNQQKQQMPQGQQGQDQMQKDKHHKSHTSHHQKQLRQHMPDHGMYGHEMMTAEERERYRQQLNSARSDLEWSQLRAEHQREMQARARAQGHQLDPPLFGQHMMTMEEQNRYAERMEAAKDAKEKARIREEHQQMMMQRAQELGIGEMLAEQ